MRRFLWTVRLLAIAGLAVAQPLPTIVLGTVGGSPDGRVNMVEGQLPDERPGWFIELSRRAAKICGADADFVFMPWARFLKQIEAGSIAGGFNSSYRPERTAYGVYPMVNGRPDKRRPSKLYAYFSYAATGMDGLPDLDGLPVVVERAASFVAEFKKRGAEIVEVVSYTTMLRVAAAGRVPLAVGIGDRLDRILERDGSLSAGLQKLEPPIAEKVGYVMFSKAFYAVHRPCHGSNAFGRPPLGCGKRRGSTTCGNTTGTARKSSERKPPRTSGSWPTAW